MSLKAGAGNAQMMLSKELLPLEGFCHIHDLPKVSVLLLENDVKIAIVVIEIVMLPDSMVAECKKIIAELAEIPGENVWIHVTHAIATPHAPGGPMLGLGGNEIKKVPISGASITEIDKKVLYETAVFAAVKGAAKEALSKFQPAVMQVAAGSCDLIQGRDISTSKGWWIGIHGENESNKTMTILSFTGLDGKRLGCLISYAMKPCVIDNAWMEKGLREISADAPGKTCRLLENELNVPVLYCMSAAADQIPIKTAWYDEVNQSGEIKTIDLGVEKGLAYVDEIGLAMARKAFEILQNAGEIQKDPKIECKRGSFLWKTKGRIAMHPYQTLTFEPNGKTELEVNVFTIGNVALVGTKPEMNMISEKQLQEQSDYEHTLLVSMVNGGMKYMPDQKSYDELHWEALSSMLMPGAAETFVKEAVKLCNN